MSVSFCFSLFLSPMSVSKKCVSLRTMLNAVSQQGKNIEASIDAKDFEKK